MTRDFARSERGSTAVEVAMAATVFFVMIFGIIEFGRLLYTHNALTDATRRGARFAVLHAQNHPCVEKVVVYGESHVDVDDAECTTSGSPLINGLTEENIVVTYEGADLDGNPDSPNPWGTNLGTATVSIEEYQFDLSIPFIGRTLNMPAYSTTLTSESAGTEPDPL